MKETKEPIKVRLSTVILSFIIFILIIAMIGMYFYYNKNTDKEIVETSVESDNKQGKDETKVETEETNTNIASVEIKEIDVNSEIIEKIYEYILKFRAYDETLVYQSKKVTNENIDNKLKLSTIFHNLKESDASEVDVTDESMPYVKQEIFKQETIESKAKEIFGEDINIRHENSSYEFAVDIIYEDGKYKRCAFQGGGGTPWESSKNVIVKAQQKGDEIYIYDKYVHIVDDLDNNTSDIYTASDRKVKIKENVNLQSDGIYQGLENLGYQDYDKQFFNNMERIYGNSIKTFKHTFKKNTDGSYYWYSTEPVE